MKCVLWLWLWLWLWLLLLLLLLFWFLFSFKRATKERQKDVQCCIVFGLKQWWKFNLGMQVFFEISEFEFWECDGASFFEKFQKHFEIWSLSFFSKFGVWKFGVWAFFEKLEFAFRECWSSSFFFVLLIILAVFEKDSEVVKELLDFFDFIKGDTTLQNWQKMLRNWWNCNI